MAIKPLKLKIDKKMHDKGLRSYEAACERRFTSNIKGYEALNAYLFKKGS